MHTAHGRDADAGLHPAGDQGDGAGAGLRRGRRARLPADPRQHLPPVRLARAGADRQGRRAARVHGLGAGADHRLGRLPGLLARPRRGRRRGQGERPAGGEQGSVVSIGEEGVRFRSYRDGAELFISPEVSMEVQAALGVRHRPRLRRVHALPRRPRLHRALDRAHPSLARALPGVARGERAGAPGRLRDRPGRGPRGPAARVGAGGLRGRRRRDRDRRHPRARQGGDGRGPGDHRAAPARGGAQAPARDRRGRRPARRDRPRPRRLRLRRADPPRPPRRGPRPRPRAALSPRPAQGRLGGRPRPAGRGLPLPGLPRPRPRLHQLPLARRGADRRPPALPPQPHLHASNCHSGARDAIALGSSRDLSRRNPRRRQLPLRPGSPGGGRSAILLGVLFDQFLRILRPPCRPCRRRPW